MELKVKDYYGKMRFYPFMPKRMFDTLEQAFLNKQEVVEVEESDYNEMQAAWETFTSTAR